MNTVHGLLVMRLADMRVVHPQQITSRCNLCNELVGIYPSGQRIMAAHPDVELICERCHNPRDVDVHYAAPGALEERAESVPKKT